MRLFAPITLITIFILNAPAAYAVLQSGVSKEVQEQIAEPDPAPAPSKRTVHIKMRAKDTPADQKGSQSGQYMDQEQSSGEDNFFNEDDAYQMNYSKNVHPANTRPDGTSPVVQTVSGPRTTNYGRPQPATVVNPGRPQGGGSGTASVRPRNNS